MHAARCWSCLSLIGFLLIAVSSCKTTSKEKNDEKPQARCITQVKIERDLIWLSFVDRAVKRVSVLSMDDPLNPQEILSIDTEYQLDPLNTVYLGDSVHIFSSGAVLSFNGIQERKPTKTGQHLWAGIMSGERIKVIDDQFFMSGPLLSRGMIENGALNIRAYLKKEDYLTQGSEDIVMAGDYLYNIRSFSGLEVIDYKKNDQLDPVGEVDLRHAQRMVRVGNYLYLVGTSRLESVSNDEVGLQIVDISQPTAPRYVKAIPIPGMEDEIVEWNGKLYIGGKGVLHTVNISDPENPRFEHTLDLTGLGGNSPGIDGSVDAIAVRSDGLAYVALVCQSWLVLDLRGDHPRVVKKF